MIIGPTFAEMLNPNQIEDEIRQRALRMRHEDPLDPINLFNITWKDTHNRPYAFEVPKELTGVKANIVIIYGKPFPTGSHKVGAAYSVLVEKQLFGEVDPNKHKLVWPSTGNYGIGGAWVGSRMGCDSTVILPAGMSSERFELIESYGSKIIRTPGSESNVKEIYDKTWELRADPDVRILNQFEVMGNYRFHYHVTGNSVVDLADMLLKEGTGNGRIAAFVSSMGSSGTIGAGDRLKQVFPESKIVGLEPIQCPTLFNNGYGSHDIQGIGDKHVTWVHNVWNMDALMCIDDWESKRALQMLNTTVGQSVLEKEYGVEEHLLENIAPLLGISGVCNLIGAIKTAKYYDYGEDETIVTVATDSLSRYHSVMDDMKRDYGDIDQARAVGVVESLLHGQKTDWIMDGTREARTRWHNLKYYTWVEQQGKTVEELDAQRDPAWWEDHQAKVADIDAAILDHREKHGYTV